MANPAKADSPLTGFYDPSKIGSYGDTAASQIQPNIKPIANVAGGYAGMPTATPASVPSMSDIGLNDPFSGSNSDFYAPGQPVADTGASATAPITDPGFYSGGPSPAATAAAAGPAAVGGSNWWDDFINGITGGHGIAGELGSMAPYLADFALAQKFADKQQSETNKTIQPLFTQANQYLDAATKDLKLYESGTVNPAQQKMIDAYSVSQKAQVAQQLQNAGISDSGARNSANQQIDNNAMMMKQNFVQQSLTNALNLEQAGMQPLLIAIQDKLLSDTDISKTMMELTGTLAQAWAYQQGQEARGGGGGGGGGGAAAGGAAGAVGGDLLKQGENFVKGKITDWLGGGASGAAADAMGAAGLADLSGSAAADVAGLAGIDMGITDASLTAAGGAGGLGAVAGSGFGIDEAALGGLAGPLAVAGGIGLGAFALDKIGNHYNWFGGNDPSKVKSIHVPKGVQTWKSPKGDNIYAVPSATGATLAMGISQGHGPGDPVLFPKGADPYNGTGGWELKGFKRGHDNTVYNQQTGQAMDITDPNFVKTFGITGAQFKQMYNLLVSSYSQ